MAGRRIMDLRPGSTRPRVPALRWENPERNHDIADLPDSSNFGNFTHALASTAPETDPARPEEAPVIERFWKMLHRSLRKARFPHRRLFPRSPTSLFHTGKGHQRFIHQR
jgi:hypothetical protein